MKIDCSVYRGYINDKELVISGHVFKSWAPSQYSIQNRSYKHAFSIYKMFTIKPLSNVKVTLQFKNTTVTTKTLNDGFFSFRIPFSEKIEPGWHPCTVVYEKEKFSIVANGEILNPHLGMYGIISDIDDTFLISHSSNFFKKLYVMLTQNIDKREVFTDVSEHYRALSIAGQQDEKMANSFFYVSSSEWNLYSFIVAIAQKHHLPKAVIKLKNIKSNLADFFFTGGGNHDHKFEKIKNIVSFYPTLQYVLLGDDSQKDPFIYERICKIFPKNISVVYIRQTKKRQKENVAKVLKNIESISIKTSYFRDSSEAIAHSKEIGLIK